MGTGGLPRAEARARTDQTYPPLEAMREFIEPWMRTREAYGPVWWPEFRRLSGTSLDRAQFNLLRVIAHAPPRSLKELSAVAMMSSSTASRLIESLVRAGVVERVVPADDRRVTLIRASAEGRSLIDDSERVGASLLAGPFSAMSSEQIRAFTEVFQLLAPIVEQWATEPERWCDDARARREAPDGCTSSAPAGGSNTSVPPIAITHIGG